MAEREQGREVLADRHAFAKAMMEQARISQPDTNNPAAAAIADYARAVEAERDRYWDALAPFQRLRVADAPDTARLKAEHSDEDDHYNVVCPIEGIRMGDLYAARAALQGGQSDGE